MNHAPLLLLAEDEPLIALAAEDSLIEAGYTVLLAADGVEGKALIEREQGRLALIVTDIRLGAGPDGWELARHARALDPATPIVYMTGDSAHQWPVEGVGGSLLVQKPYAAAQLLAAVAALLGAPAESSPQPV